MNKFLTLISMVAFMTVAVSQKIQFKTSYGDFVVELDLKNAPITSKNFLDYVDSGFYNDTVFHRVINGFMVQGGGFDTNFDEKPTKQPIENEAANGLRNEVATLAMARTSDPHSATAQFFVNVSDNSFLNHTAPNSQGYGYAVFAKVVKGYSVIEKIAKVKTGNKGHHQDVPAENVIMTQVERLN